MVTINHLVASAIKKTSDPTAPIKLQELHKYCCLVGKMLTSIADKNKVMMLSERLLKDFPEKELNKISATPEFTIILASCLANAVIRLTNKMAGDPT